MRCSIKAFRLNADGSVDDVDVVVDDLIVDDMVGALIIHEVLNLMDDLARLIALGGDGSDMS